MWSFPSALRVLSAQFICWFRDAAEVLAAQGFEAVTLA
jgi:hypothetical protein